MISCAACGTENRPGRKFCAECGASLGMTCPTCGTGNEPGEKFCGDCGSQLSSASPASVPAPVPVTAPAAGERKQITVLFADVAGSMDLQERLDAEVWAEIMSRFVGVLTEGIRRFGGTVDKFTGDGVMALFGAPVAQEDHARRACHAAWHLTKAIGDYSDELRRDQGLELHVRLGLNSGEVVVGRVGNDVTLDPTALGHTVGLAQRMEAMAEPGKAYLTEHTARLVDGWFGLEHLGARPVKGSAEPMGVHALQGPLSSPARPGVGAAPLVGRERELAVLDHGLTMATDGHAQVLGVVGEAGVGKSRLCDEFARSAEARGAIVLRTAGISHGKDVPLLPILSFLRHYFGIIDTDSPTDAREKVAARLLALDAAFEGSLPFLFDFLEIPDPRRPAPQLAGDARMNRLFTTFRRITARRSEREVLVLLAEDLHWFDPQSETFLERLIESFPGSRTLVVANFRPEFSARWMRHSYYRQLPVTPLQDAAVGELLGGLLGMDFSLAPLLAFVQERTGGNPFFVEEVVRALVEDGTLTGQPGHYRLTRPLHEVNVPPSVQAVLAARIDRLSDVDKSLLQTASVIGRHFSAPVLVLASGRSEDEVAAAAARLCAAEFLQESSVDPVEEYRFWHPLTREVAYNTLLRDRRVALHEAVAAALIPIYSDRLDERAALIALHFEQAGNDLEAARWNDRAANFALRNDVVDAMRRWRATLRHLASAPETKQALELGVRARNRLIRYGARTGMDVAEAGELYADARVAAERLQDPVQLASVTFGYGTTLFWRGAVRDGIDLYLEAARLADQTGDVEARAGYWIPPAALLPYTGPVSEGLRVTETVLALCNGTPEVGTSVLGFSPLSVMGLARAEPLFLAGEGEAARAALCEALAVARQRGELEWVGWTLTIEARLATTADEFQASLDSAHEALRLAEDSGNASNRVLALGAIGIAEAGLGRFAAATEHLEEALTEARHRQVALFEEARLLAYLARSRLAGGDCDAAREAADEAVDVAHRQGARTLECFALLTRTEVARSTGVPHDAIVPDLDAAADLIDQTGAVVYEPFVQEHRRHLAAERRARVSLQ